MVIYCAGKWEEKERAREVMLQLIQAGYVISYDWTAYEQESSKQAEADINGVLGADIFVGIFEKDLNYLGALIEMGAALGLGMPCYIIGDAPVTKSLFFQHPLVHWGIERLLKKDVYAKG